MPFVAIAGIIAGLTATQWMPLPKWRLLADLIRLGMLIAGADGLVVLEFPQAVTSPSVVWQRLVCGLLAGCGAGYFLRWFRVGLTIWVHSRREKNEGGNIVGGNRR